MVANWQYDTYIHIPDIINHYVITLSIFENQNLITHTLHGSVIEPWTFCSIVILASPYLLIVSEKEVQTWFKSNKNTV